MSEDNRRRIVNQFMDILRARKYDDLFALSTADATWWVSGPHEKLPIFGEITLAERVAQMKESFGKALAVSYVIRGMTVDVEGGSEEGGTVVMESVTRAEGPGEGQVYENEILTKFVFVEGKIWRIREYLDATPIFRYMRLA